MASLQQPNNQDNQKSFLDFQTKTLKASLATEIMHINMNYNWDKFSGTMVRTGVPGAGKKLSRSSLD
jgi:hypothetical protein